MMGFQTDPPTTGCAIRRPAARAARADT